MLVAHRQRLHLLLILINSMNTKKITVISLICIFVIVLLGMFMVYRQTYYQRDSVTIPENVIAKVHS